MQESLKTNIEKVKKSTRLKDYLAIFIRRRWIIIIAFLSIVLSTFFYVMHIADIFESFSTIVIEEQNVLISRSLNYSGRSLSFYKGILNSRTYLELVLDSIGMPVIHTHFPRFTREDALRYIQENIMVCKNLKYNKILDNQNSYHIVKNLL